MPPKRKKNDIEQESKPSSDRATRSSSRITVDIAPVISSNQILHGASRKFSGRGGATSNRSGPKKAKQNDQAETELSESASKRTKRGLSNKANVNEGTSAEGAPATSSRNQVKHQVYAKSRMVKLFEAYADVEDPSYIGADGLERLCTDGNISMDGAQPLILAWFLQASELGKFTKEEWLKGCNTLKIDTLEKLAFALIEHESQLIFNEAAPTIGRGSKPYNRHAMYSGREEDIPAAFCNFYTFVFSLAKSHQARNIDAEMAKIFWLTLLAPKYPMVKDFVDYIDKHTNLKGVNKDLWVMTLEFFQSGASLDNYEADGAWPTLIDNFAAWRTSVDLNAANVE